MPQSFAREDDCADVRLEERGQSLECLLVCPLLFWEAALPVVAREHMV